jgi:hypothetical protein
MKRKRLTGRTVGVDRRKQLYAEGTEILERK